MAGVNRVILIGNIGKDPEMKYFDNGDAVCNFSIATSETWKDKTTGEKQERTEWHRISTFKKLAEICGKYLVKGTKIYIEGKLRTRSWEKDGSTHYVTEIIADQMQMLSSKSDNNGGGGQSSGPPQQQQQQQGSGNGNYGGYDDDIPF